MSRSFYNIYRDLLLKLISREINDAQFKNLISDMLKGEVPEDVETDPASNLLGTLQGGVISPLFLPQPPSGDPATIESLMD